MKKTTVAGIFAPWVTLLFAGALFFSCEFAQRGESNAPDSSSTMVQAVEWDEIKYQTLRSEITLLRTGHFYVNRNACYRRESGTLELSTWNRVASIINLAWTTPRTENELCVSLSSALPALGSEVVVLLQNGTQQRWISLRAAKACAFIGAPEPLTALLEALAETARIARQEGC